ncbi:MAG: hypothetical protein C0593_04870 [Marinilabiliales bacterium]|nr:MAG: hypothetical protein C0593_04870 [Marinilabiliales bacterium]
MKLFIALYTLIIPVSLNVFSQVNEDDICGYWFTENNEAIIKITKNGDNTFSGMFCWLLEPNEPDSTNANFGNPIIDQHTGMPYLQTIILRDAVYAETGKWKGEIYDPRHGTTYKCNISLSENSQTMTLKGYIGISLLGKKIIWTRTCSCQ